MANTRRGRVPRGMQKHLRSLRQEARHASDAERPEIVSRIEEAYSRYANAKAGEAKTEE